MNELFLVFPFQGVVAKSPVASKLAVMEAPVQSDKVLKVLLVEDSTSLQKLLVRWLRTRGCEVTSSSNGKDALNLLRTEQHFDIVFLDFLMVVTYLLTISHLFYLTVVVCFIGFSR